MKPQRFIFGTVLAGLGLILLVVLGWLRPGAPSASHGAASNLTEGKVDPAPESLLQQEGTDPARGVVLVSTNPSPAKPGLVQVTTPFLRHLVSTLESARGERDPSLQEKKLEGFAQEVAPADLSAAIGFLFDRSASKLERELGLRLVRRWVESDPKAAAEWVDGGTKGPSRQAAINEVALVWGSRNFPEAAGWVRQLADPEERQGGLISLAYEAARSQPLEALKLAMEMSANTFRNDLVTHTASQWAASEPRAAAEWANQIADPDLRERVLAGVTTAWGESDPVTAGAWAVKSLGPGKHQDDAVVGVVQRWVQKEPQQAAAWVLEFPEGTLRNSALENLVSLWADQDLDQAGNWLNSLASGAIRDLALSAYVSKVAPLFPEVAVDWASEIGEEAVRNRQIENVAGLWMDTDAAAARAWVRNAPLPGETKARLLALKGE